MVFCLPALEMRFLVGKFISSVSSFDFRLFDFDFFFFSDLGLQKEPDSSKHYRF